jgi:hypothetical protein
LKRQCLPVSKNVQHGPADTKEKYCSHAVNYMANRLKRNARWPAARAGQELPTRIWMN